MSLELNTLEQVAKLESLKLGDLELEITWLTATVTRAQGTSTPWTASVNDRQVSLLRVFVSIFI